LVLAAGLLVGRFLVDDPAARPRQLTPASPGSAVERAAPASAGAREDPVTGPSRPRPSSPPTRPSEVVTEAWLRRAQEEVGSREYAPLAQGAEAHFTNRAQRLRASFGRAGVEVRSQSPATGEDWRWTWQLRGVGRGAGPTISAVDATVVGERVELRHGHLVEWYTNTPAGIEQGFDVFERPAGPGPLVLSADVTCAEPGRTGLRAARTETGGLLFSSDSRGALLYDGLHVVDATGADVPASIEWRATPGGGELALFVHDDHATYPLRVDPLLSSPAWTAEGDEAGARFGSCVASAGDVNGDGFSDVIVGASMFPGGGKAFVFHGSASGLDATPAWTADAAQLGVGVGSAVAGAGDVNGDGYSDVILGVPWWDGGQVNEGRAVVFHGSATGLGTTPAWSAESDQAFAGMGNAVASAGDVDGDGYSDVIVGASLFSNGQSGEGRAFLFHGSASGLALTSAWTGEADVVDARFGASVAGANDVNGDGFDDVIVGAPELTADQAREGRAYVYLGSLAGLATAPAWVKDGNQGQATFGSSVAGAGDVDGDGYADVIVGAPEVSILFFEDGAAFVFRGSTTGVAMSPAWTYSGGEQQAFLGRSVAGAGDVNGDGYADVAVGAPLHGGSNDGRVLVFEGASAGLGAAPTSTFDGGLTAANLGASVAGAGDVDGDGFADLLVGAPLTSGGQTNEGRTSLFRGSGSPPTLAASWSVEGFAHGANLGHAVAPAGDVNGDGFGDVIIGAPAFDRAITTTTGRAMVYLGSESGLALTPAWTVDRDNHAGAFVAGAGDVNGDGFSDVIVDGKVYHGSRSGLSAAPDWTAPAGSLFGVASAGDVNGDGFSDVIVGAGGLVAVYLGSTAGLSTSFVWSVPANIVTRFACAGDVNGDGFSDLIGGDPSFDAPGQTDAGRASLYLGSAAGPTSTPAWTADGGRVNATFGGSVASAGDVDGDGFDDVLVGAPGFSNGEIGEGRVFLFRGSATGLEATAAWTAESNEPGARLGHSIAGAGDVNGDTYADVVVGSPRHDDGGQVWEGLVVLYLGGGGGLGSTPDWIVELDRNGAELGNSVAGAGDVDGDGFADVLVGAYRYRDTFDRGGRAFVFNGNGGRGLITKPRQRRTDDTATVSHGLTTDRATSMLVRVLARGSVGRARARLLVEVEPLGVPFDGAGLTSTGWTDTGLSGVDLTALIGGLAPGTVHHWRARVETFPDRRGPWLSCGTTGSDADFRTPLDGAPRPGHVRDGAGPDIDFQASTTRLDANWGAFVDPTNGITGFEWAIGTTPGASDVQGFVPVGLALEASATGLSLVTTTYYVTVRATNGVGGTFEATSDGVLVDTSAPLAGLVEDGGNVDVDFWSFDHNIVGNWSGFTDPESGIVSYEWAVGSTPGGTDVLAFTDRGFGTVGARTIGSTNPFPRLVHGATYYVTARARNGAGLTVVATSDGVTIDTTLPLGGTVRDGPGAIDIDAQTSLTTIEANWSPFSDPETGVTVAWTIGTTRGGTEVQGLVDVGSALSASNSSLTLVPGQTYYVAVVATNGAGGVLRLTTDGVTVDTTPPMGGTVRDGTGSDVDTQTSLTTIDANWFGFFDSQSGISEYEWAIGTTPGGTDVQPLTSVGTATAATRSGLTLALGVTCYVTVRATNGIGLFNSSTSDGVRIVDGTPPTAGSVNDGLGVDVDVQTSTSAIEASWSGFADAESGISGYEWAIGTTPGGTDLQGFTSVGVVTSAARSGLSLVYGSTYFATVRATNAFGGTMSATSDGVQVIDASPPTAGSVDDGPGADVDAQTSTTTIEASWVGFADPETGISAYEWAIGTSPGGEEIQPFTSVGVVTSAVRSGLALVYGTTYFTTVRATNGFALTVSATSDGVQVVDAAPPIPGTVSDGPGADVDNQASATTVEANWTGFTDPETGIVGYEWAIGTAPGASDVQPFTGVGTATTASASGFNLQSGSTYFVVVRATNGAGLTSQAASDGVMVVVPPTAGVVNDGPGADIDEQPDGTTLEASWSRFSGPITRYEWAIGTVPGSTNVQRYIDVGLSTRAVRTGLSLIAGTRYHVTVRAVGPTNLVAVATSDGVVFAPPRKKDKDDLVDTLLTALTPAGSTTKAVGGCMLVLPGAPTSSAPITSLIGLLLVLRLARRTGGGRRNGCAS
jgi:hypothetical protein